MAIFTFKRKTKQNIEAGENFANQETENIKVQNSYSWWSKIGRWSLLSLIFLLPFFFLPWTLWPTQFNKEILSILLISVSLICWLGKSISQGKVTFIKLKYNWFIGLFLFLLLIPTIFSVQWMKSLTGGFILPDSYLSFLLFGLVFFLAGAFFSKRDKALISYALSGSLLIVSLLVAGQILGKFYLIFRNWLHLNFFGSVIGLNIYLSIGLVAILGLILIGRIAKWKKVLLSIFSLLILFELIVINYYLSWLILAIALIVWISYSLAVRDKRYHLDRLGLILAVIVLTISISFLIFKFSLPSKWVVFPAEVTPSWHSMINIAHNVWQGRSYLVGSGLSTFNYDYTLYRPTSIIQSQFWNVSFNQGLSVISTILSTGGLVGLLAWLFLILGIILLNLYLLKKKNKLFVEFFVGSIIFLLIIFLCPADFTILTLSFFLAGIFLATAFNKKEIILTQSPQRAMFSFLTMFLIIIAILVGDYWVGCKYTAAVYAQKGVNLLSEKKTDLAISKLSRAINLDSSCSQYYVVLDQALWQKIPQELKNSKNQSSKKQAESLIQQSILSSKKATQIDSHNVNNWINLGNNYRNLIGLINNADEFSIDAYHRAIALDPANPIILIDLTQAYLSSADVIQREIQTISKQAKAKTKKNYQKIVQQLKSSRQKRLSSAEKSINQVLKLRPNYLDADYLLVQVKIKQGKIKQAISQLKQINKRLPSDANILYQLGQLYYSQKNLELAQKNFEQAIKINPKFSNARYLLGLIYKQQGNKKAALEQFEKVLKFNPNNAEIKKLIQGLEKGEKNSK